MKTVSARPQCALVLAALIMSGTVSPAVSAEPIPAETAAIDWLRSTATPFSDAAPPHDELSPLIAHLGDAQVIGIGEATHGDHQDQAFKAELIKALIETGRIDALALECSRQAGADFDAYVTTGKGDLTALVRSKNFFRIWHDDEFAGLILWIRAWNVTAIKPVKIVGIDNQDANTDIKFALAFIRKKDPALAKRLAAATAPMLTPKAQQKFYTWVIATPKVQFDMAVAGVQAVKDAFTAHEGEWRNSPGFEEARYAAKVAAQGLHEFNLEAGNPDFDITKATPEYSNRRDVYMAANLVEMAGGKKRLALWAHDMHVLSHPDADTIAQGYVSMGSELYRALGSNYASIGFAWSQGRFNTRLVGNYTAAAVNEAPDDTAVNLPNNRPGDLGEVLARIGMPRFWVDLRNPPVGVTEWGKTPYQRGWAGAIVNTELWQTRDDQKMAMLPSHDILVYFNTITPSHMWKKMPPPKP